VKLGGIERTFKQIEIYAGLSIMGFAAGTFISWALMSRLVERPELLPDGASRQFWVSLIHDAGYAACAPIFAFLASRLIAANRWLPAVVIVAANYLIEEVVVFIAGGERVFWAWPWGFSGRAAAIGVALALSLVVAPRNRQGRVAG